MPTHTKCLFLLWICDPVVKVCWVIHSKSEQNEHMYNKMSICTTMCRLWMLICLGLWSCVHSIAEHESNHSHWQMNVCSLWLCSCSTFHVNRTKHLCYVAFKLGCDSWRTLLCYKKRWNMLSCFPPFLCVWSQSPCCVPHLCSEFDSPMREERVSDACSKHADQQCSGISSYLATAILFKIHGIPFCDTPMITNPQKL